MIELSEMLIFAKKNRQIDPSQDSNLLVQYQRNRRFSENMTKRPSKTGSSQEAISGQDSGKQLNAKWEKIPFLISLTFVSSANMFCQIKA